MMTSGRVAFVYGSRVGIGGLGLQVGNAISDLASTCMEVMAIGPGRSQEYQSPPGRLHWVEVPPPVSSWSVKYTWFRWRTGRLQYLTDQRNGARAAHALSMFKPDFCYCFTQVGLETLKWANAARVPAILESPNGHLANFRDVYVRESERWDCGPYRGHPSQQMVARVEEEYARADVIRVSSDWAKRTFIERGISPEKVMVIPQRPMTPYKPAPTFPQPDGPLRVCFVGTLDLRKGFAYLLRAARRFGPHHIHLTIVGGTCDRATRRLLAQERIGLDVHVVPGNPTAAYAASEVFVLPTLEDGSPFVVLEAMASGLPLIVTEECGNHPLIRPGQTGWVIRMVDEAVLACALNEALHQRTRLVEMGRQARLDWEALAAEYSATGSKRFRSLIDRVLKCSACLESQTPKGM